MPADPSPPSAPPPPSTVFSLIHELHATVTSSIDTALSWDQLNSPPINYTLVRPIVARFSPHQVESEKRPTAGDGLLDVPRQGAERGPSRAGAGAGAGETGQASLGAILYALMANRIQFLSLSDSDLSYSPLQRSRAAFCELLAMKILRTFPSTGEEAELTCELVRPWCPFDGASEDVWQSMGDDRKEVEQSRGSALELAIVSAAKHFLSLPLIQHLISQIYNGNLIYIPQSSRSLISDSYVSERTKRRRRASHSSNTAGAGGTPTRPRPPPLHLEAGERLRRHSLEDAGAEVFVYNPFEAGWLDHQRLRVPKWRNALEFLSFGILMGLFIATLATKNIQHLHPVEVVFMVFVLGFALDEFAASKEHGWTIYAANAWNAFDLAYLAIFFLYLGLRTFALATDSPATSDLAFDILACGACIMFPRLVFFAIKDNLVILALRAMIARFVGFMGLTIVAFSGICFCLWTLGRATWTVKQIVWLMLQIWFGSSYLGFSASQSFHPIFGPIVLISYAALSNVLLITILIAILSNKFAEINANAQEEHLFQRVVKTVEGVKSDAVFSYLPPINIAALVLLLPLSWVCSPRTLHRVNVFSIRMTSFPILIGISAYERWSYKAQQRAIALRSPHTGGLTDHIQRPSLFDSFLGGGTENLISSVFEAGPPTLPPSHVGNVTPPKASSVSGRDETESEESEAPLDVPAAPAASKRTGAGRGGLDSPLAKLFGKPESLGGAARAERGRAGKGKSGRASKKEVEALKEELKEVRESQLRVEEMLSKVLAGSSK